MTDLEDLKRRLATIKDNDPVNDLFRCDVEDYCLEALAAITALEAENEKMVERLSYRDSTNDILEAKITELLAECERLSALKGTPHD